MLRSTLLCLLLAATFAHATEPAPIARVNGQAIPATRFEAALKTALARGGNDTQQLRSQIRGQLIAQELLRQAAYKKKLQDDPVVAAAREEIVTRLMIERYVALTVKPEEVSEAAVRARYETIVQSLGDKEYRLAVIALGKEDEARQLLRELRQNEASFADLARKHSLVASRDNGGLLDWVSFRTPVVEGHSGGLPLPIARAVTGLGSLTPGTLLAEPVAAEGRYWLIRLNDVRPTQIPDYAAAAPGVRRMLEALALERASAALIQRLIAAARIE